MLKLIAILSLISSLTATVYTWLTDTKTQESIETIKIERNN